MTFQYISLIQYYPQFPKIILNLRLDYRRVTEQYAGTHEEPALAWLSRTQIAATSRRINGYSVDDYILFAESSDKIHYYWPQLK